MSLSVKRFFFFASSGSQADVLDEEDVHYANDLQSPRYSISFVPRELEI